MWWLVVAAGLFFFRGKIAEKLAPLMPSMASEKTVTYGHAITLIAAITYILPLPGLPKRPAYIISMWSTVLASGFAIKSKCGSPPVPQNLSWSNWKQTLATTVQPWLQRAMLCGDFHFLFFALIFLTAYPSIWVLLILVRRSLWAVCTYCVNKKVENKLWLMFKPTWGKLQAREMEVLSYAALSEILLAFWLTASLFLPSRQIITCFLYWNYLKTRYQAGCSAMRPGESVQISGLQSAAHLNGQRATLQYLDMSKGRWTVRLPNGEQKALKPENLQMTQGMEPHIQAWRQLGQHVEPLLKAVPFLKKPIDYAVQWFQPQYQYQ